MKVLRTFNLKAKTTLLAAGWLVATCSLSLYPALADAAVTNPAPTAKVSFTFDDGLASASTQAAPTLAKYGLTGTDYVISGCVGMAAVPNSCRANNDASYMTWEQITALQNTNGWEIGSHTVTHPYLATSDAGDGQPNVLTLAQVTQELTKSKSDLAAHGVNATDFSSPYGDYNNAVLAQIAKVYASQRGFADQNNNIWPYNDYLINNYPVQAGVTVAQVKAKIDAAIAGKYWLVLTMHDIKPTPSTDPDDYEYSTSELDQIAAYVKLKQNAGLIQSVHVNQGLVTSDSNLLANDSFNSGLASGWTTDDAANITVDANNNGSYPDATRSVKLVSNPSRSTHLFSPKVSVNPNTSYGFKNFLNVQKITSGQVAFYIDEYNANGAWVSGQYKTAEKSAFVENLNFTYKPTSAAVSKASLQVVVAGSGITAYLDNVQWFPLTTTAPPPPTQTNLVSNGTFDAGISGGWTTDSPTTITADANNNGSPNNPAKSVKLVGGTKNGHLFSPLLTVSNTKQYSLTTYLNLKARTSGEVGFYIDEYNAAGNWVSGQYKTGVFTLGAADVGFSYIPSSSNVAKASLQIIVVSNSGITAYVDDVRWYSN